MGPCSPFFLSRSRRLLRRLAHSFVQTGAGPTSTRLGGQTSLILCAIALAVLGVIMAVGMVVIVSRGDSLDFDWFRSHFVPDTEIDSGQADSGARADGPR